MSYVITSYRDFTIDTARITDISFYASEHDFKVSFWVETSVRMTCAISISHHRETNILQFYMKTCSNY